MVDHLVRCRYDSGWLPDSSGDWVRSLFSPYSYLRVQSPVTALMGPQYRRSRTRLEIDLTWACNLRCHNCNRSCSQVPSVERIELEQIRRFVDESVASAQSWEQIRLLGGEPTLHPELDEILAVLLTWRSEHSPATRIELTSNGYGPRVARVIQGLPTGVVVNNTRKSSRSQSFRSFNIAPLDRAEYTFADYRNGCRVIQVSGIGLTPYGWYPCPIAGGIDRVMGFDLGLKRMPEHEDDMLDQLRTFCPLCGHFKRLFEFPLGEPRQSGVWLRAYTRYRQSPPALTRY
ncbi:MAG: radical SAM protein [Candidatus Thiodiazotropha sp.]